MDEIRGDDIDKSVNMVLANEAALERVMKNCMPAFVKMSQQMAGLAHESTESAGQSTRNPSTDSVGESNLDNSMTQGIAENLTQLNIDSQDQGLDDSQAQDRVRPGESEVTLYRRGCTKVGEINTLHQLPIIQNIQNELNKWSQSVRQRQAADCNITGGLTSDSDNVTSDESALFTSSDDLDSSNHDTSNHVNLVAASGGGALAGRTAVQVQPSKKMRVVSAAAGSAATSVGQHVELEKVRAEERALEIVKQAANAKNSLLKPPGERISTVSTIDPSDGIDGSVLVSSNDITEQGQVRDRIREAFMIDQKHSSIGAFVDDTVKMHIQAGGYINLSRLLPKDTVVPDDDLVPNDRQRWNDLFGQGVRQG